MFGIFLAYSPSNTSSRVTFRILLEGFGHSCCPFETNRLETANFLFSKCHFPFSLLCTSHWHLQSAKYVYYFEDSLTSQWPCFSLNLFNSSKRSSNEICCFPFGFVNLIGGVQQLELPQNHWWYLLLYSHWLPALQRLPPAVLPLNHQHWIIITWTIWCWNSVSSVVTSTLLVCNCRVFRLSVRKNPFETNRL